MLRATATPIRPSPANPTVIAVSVPVSDEDLPTVHHVHLPGHVVGLRRGQVHEERRELLWRGRSADERSGCEVAHWISFRGLIVDRTDVFVQSDPHRGVD